MSSKKKPAAPKGPSPLLKLKFEKFPDKQVPVFFEPAKRCFYADFGFEQYEAASVNQLEQKIKAAIQKGATPTQEWIPVIVITCERPTDDRGPDKFSVEPSLEIERLYLSIGKSGLREVEWKVAPAQRARNSCDSCAGFPWGIARKMRTMPKLPHFDNSFGGEGAVLPYDEAVWQKLCAIMGQFQASRDSFKQATKKLNFDSVFVPKAAAAPQKPKPVKIVWAQPPSAVKSSKKDFQQVRESAGRQIVKDARANQDNPQQKLWAVLDALIDVPAFADIPQSILRAAGFKAGTTGHADGEKMEFTVRQPHDKAYTFSKADLQARIRRNWDERKFELFEPAPSGLLSTQGKSIAVGKLNKNVVERFLDKHPEAAPGPEDRNELAQHGSAGKASKKKSSSGGAAQKEKTRLTVNDLIAIPEGRQDEDMVKRAGYPPGTVIIVSGRNVDITPPDHVAMLYSRKWFEERLRINAKGDMPAPLFNGSNQEEMAEEVEDVSA